MLHILPAILTKNIANAQKQLNLIENLVDEVHIDIMDGVFVKNNTLLPKAFADIKTNLKLEAHLMVQDIELFAKQAIENNFFRILCHIEPLVDAGPIISLIKKHNKQVGLAINPETPIERVLPYLDTLDMVLLMSVHPGWSGQKFIQETLDKAKKLNKIIETKNLNTKINIDGGINLNNAHDAIGAGAKYLVANSAIFDNPKFSLEKAITTFKKLI